MDIETFAARGLQILLALGGAYLIALWFVLAVWTFRDIETRSRSVVTQVFSTLLVVLFWVPGLLLYRLLRPKETLDEAYQRSLEEEYLIQDLEELPLCPSCNHFIEDDFQICPHCNTQLREACSNCERLIDLRWEICPYCGTQHHGGESRVEMPVDVSDDRWIDPAAIEKRLRDAEERRIREETRALPAATGSTTLGRDLLERPFRQADRSRPQDDEIAVSADAAASNHTPTPTTVKTAEDNSGSPTETLVDDRVSGPDLSGLVDAAEGDEIEDDPTAVGTIPERYRVK